MALSNIGREPRREITEQVFGLLSLGVLIVGDYEFALWFQKITGGAHGCPWQLGLIYGLVFGVILLGFWYVAHELGELVCGWLKAFRIDPRPSQRY